MEKREEIGLTVLTVLTGRLGTDVEAGRGKTEAGPVGVEATVRTLENAIASHPGVTSVRLGGSRGRGDPVPLSDWDLEITTRDGDAVVSDLPAIAQQVQPVAAQWERLAAHACYMLMFEGGVKVDLILDVPQELQPPWEARPGTLEGIDQHFWDWIVWLAAKDQRGDRDFVRQEFEKMSVHLLQPVSIRDTPGAIDEAVQLFRAARQRLEAEMNTSVDRRMEDAAAQALRRGGYAV
ncbi:MAG: hypothetical protein ACRDG7_05590 [Candidatus Limnocylindria bacterium]